MAQCRVFQVKRTKNGVIRIPAHHKQAAPKPSTAVILCTTTGGSPDVNQLCMVTKTKRTSKSEYYWSGSTVFPGGLLNAGSEGQLVDICQKYYALWCNKYRFTFDDIMYRLNGLRELFEETGILLCRSKQDIHSLVTNQENQDITYPLKASIYNNQMNEMNEETELITEWRHKVIADPYQFQKMLESLDMIPDILCLVPWGRIQTPWFAGHHRWDARFYLALIDQHHIVHRNNLNISALGKEIIRIDWVNVVDAFGPQKVDKYETIPMVTRIQMAEFYQIIHIENCVVKEWKEAYFCRDVCVLRFKMAMRIPDRRVLTLLHGDYLYQQLADNQDVVTDMEKERDSRCLQRIEFDSQKKMKLFKVLNGCKRLYERRKRVLQSKL